MSDITVKTEGIGAVISALEAIKGRLDIATRAATQEAGRTLQSDARRNFSGSHAPGYWHVGSADKPNTVSGALQASILTTPTIRTGLATYRTTVGPTAIYSRVIELGAVITGHDREIFDVITGGHRKYRGGLSWFDAQNGVWRHKQSVTIPPRPYFTPAATALPPKMRYIFSAAWRGAIDA